MRCGRIGKSGDVCVGGPVEGLLHAEWTGERRGIEEQVRVNDFVEDVHVEDDVEQEDNDIFTVVCVLKVCFV